jgi:hypothetical protein
VKFEWTQTEIQALFRDEVCVNAIAAFIQLIFGKQ